MLGATNETLKVCEEKYASVFKLHSLSVGFGCSEFSSMTNYSQVFAVIACLQFRLLPHGITHSPSRTKNTSD